MVKIWSLPTRISHSLLVFFVAVAFLTEDFELIHEFAGFVILAVVIFRLYYGFTSKNSYEKISSFFYAPNKIFSFIKSVLIFKEEKYLGHNPLAGIVMLLIFLILILMAISGSVGYAMKEGEGVLSFLINMNSKLGDSLLDLHDILSKFLLVLIGFHLIGAIVSSILTRENLIKSIFINGLKKGNSHEQNI